ncbi:MarR family winged helix-turn-helix transcriptional regulator [Rhodococcus oxybenzonivorans]|uniref:MarR family winged helix-turn-helix transcriptional regulator n=1 Tax=Rhodococcus oxybenzonivorans TaxID=1990687 RepID=UPI001E318A13|nr:MarR family transcriptional regulator [Rhodococcus oxybenzonivorans]
MPDRGRHLRALISLLDAGRADIAATPGWLGDRLGINSASVTALLDRMEKAGLVRRTPDAEDRRRSRITVTATAMNLGETFFGPLINRTTTILEGFDPSERQTISRFLDGMNAAVAVERQVAVQPSEDSVSRSRTRRAGEPT